MDESGQYLHGQRWKRSRKEFPQDTAGTFFKWSFANVNFPEQYLSSHLAS